MSLRLKLILVLLLALVVPVLLSQWQLLGNFNAVQRAAQQDHLHKTLDVVEDMLHNLERDARFNTRLMASSGELDRYLRRSEYRLPEMTTYRALLKSWSVFLMHYSDYRQIGYADKDGRVLVQFSLQAELPALQLQNHAIFRQAVAQNPDQFIWYESAALPNTLSLFVAHGVAPSATDSVLRRGNRQYDGYVVVRIDLGAQWLTSADVVPRDGQVITLRLHDAPVVATATAAAEKPRSRRARRQLSAQRHLNDDLAVHSVANLNQLNWFDPVLIRAGIYSLLQFAVAALIFFLIVHRWLIKPLQHTLALTRQLGNGQWLEPNRFPRQDEMGTLIQAMHDMSDRLRLATAELQTKRRQAEQAERLKTEFLASISHEIRTPVNIIVGVMNRLARFVTEPRQKEYLDAASAEAHKLVHQIDELILLADLETKKQSLNAAEFFIPDLIQHVIAPYLPLLQQKQLGFDACLDDALNAVVVGDSQKIAKVLEVLLDNAVKFTAQGRVDLSVRVLEADEQHLRCEWVVQDTGPGIDAAVLPLLGKAFTQGDGSLRRDSNGLGLGLAIANGFLALMGSTLEIASSAGAGSRFSFALDLPLSSFRRQTPASV